MSPTPRRSGAYVSGLYVYPVKSLRGSAVSSARIDDLGIIGDRRFLVVDHENRFLTQRTLPRMALVTTALTDDAVVLSCPDAERITVPLRTPPGHSDVRSVTIWKSEGLLADDCGDTVAAWLSRFLEISCRLVRIGGQFRRPVLKPSARPGDVVAFTDAFPFMAISEASLNDLNDRLVARGEEAVAMDRFRPTFVISGCPPFAEDTWERIRVGEIVLRAGGPCARCIVTTIDQESANVGKEPLRLLSTYRRDANDSTRINFGQNLIHETKSGVIRVGDAVEPL